MKTPAGNRGAARPRRLVVGRTVELQRVRDVLEGVESAAVLYLYGPGGVGKTCLLQAIAQLAEDLDRPTYWLEPADLEPTPTGLTAPRPNTDGTVASEPGGLLPAGAVVLLDEVDVLPQLDWWPAIGGVLVMAGRRRPTARWLDDPAGIGTVHLIAVRNLTGAAVAELLRARGVDDPGAIERIGQETYGHPLAVAIAADEYLARPGPGHARADGTGALLAHPDATARLLGRFLDDVPGPLQREALHVCGHARRTDRALLRDVLGVDNAIADDLLSWLRERPYAEAHPDGLGLHAIVRDALDHDFRWRDREAFRSMHQRIRDVVLRRMRATTGLDYRRAAADLLDLHRGNPTASHRFTFDDPAALRPRQATEADRDTVVQLFSEREGPSRGAAARYWLRRQPSAGHVVEDATGTVVAAAVLAELDSTAGELVETDPVATWVLQRLIRLRPPEPGESVLHQFVVDGQHPDRLGPLADVMAALSLRRWADPRLGWCVLSSAYESTWVPLWSYIGFQRLGVCTVDGVDIGVWVRDFARDDYAGWLDALMGSELDVTGDVPPPTASSVALSRPDFAEAVRDLLRHLHQPHRLWLSPLIHTSLAGPEDPADRKARAHTLIQRVRDGVAHLEQDVRTAPAARALHRTYLRPAATQERAAEALGLPFSTYRRHLRAGTEQLTDLLWSWDLHGFPTDTN